jgi:hypothetical protein
VRLRMIFVSSCTAPAPVHSMKFDAFVAVVLHIVGQWAEAGLPWEISTVLALYGMAHEARGHGVDSQDDALYQRRSGAPSAAHKLSSPRSTPAVPRGTASATMHSPRLWARARAHTDWRQMGSGSGKGSVGRAQQLSSSFSAIGRFGFGGGDCRPRQLAGTRRLSYLWGCMWPLLASAIREALHHDGRASSVYRGAFRSMLRHVHAAHCYLWTCGPHLCRNEVSSISGWGWTARDGCWALFVQRSRTRTHSPLISGNSRICVFEYERLARISRDCMTSHKALPVLDQLSTPFCSVQEPNLERNVGQGRSPMCGRRTFVDEGDIQVA